MPGSIRPRRSQVCPVDQGRSLSRRPGQRPVTFVGNDAGAIRSTGPGVALTDEYWVGCPGGPDDAGVQARAVVGAQDADRGSVERQVDQGFVPDRLALLRIG